MNIFGFEFGTQSKTSEHKKIEYYTGNSDSIISRLDINEYPAFIRFVQTLSGYISPTISTNYRILPSKFDFVKDLVYQLLTNDNITIYSNSKLKEIYSKKEGESRQTMCERHDIKNNTSLRITDNKYFQQLSRVYVMLTMQDLGRVFYVKFDLDSEGYNAPNSNTISQLGDELNDKLKKALLNPASQFISTTHNLDIEQIGNASEFNKLSEAIFKINDEFERQVRNYYGYTLELNSADSGKNNNSVILSMKMFYNSIYLPYIELIDNITGKLLNDYKIIKYSPKTFEELFKDDRILETDTNKKGISEVKNG